MQTSATNKRLRQLITGIRDETLVPNPHFQRRLVWSNRHKLAFVETVLSGLPFPEIFVSAGQVNTDTGDATDLIVDGQQRITTLYEYFTGSENLRLQGSEIQPYSDLGDSEKSAFLEYQVVVRDLGPLSEDETREIFERINSTKYSLNAMEVNNARYDGALKVFSEAIASSEFFEEHRVFTSLDVRRMNDVRFSLTVVISVLSGYFNRDDEHEIYLQKYNEEFSHGPEVLDRLNSVFSFIDSCDLGSRSRAWQKADLLTLVVELDRLLFTDGLDLDPGFIGERLIDFYERVEQVTRTDTPEEHVAEYYRRVRSGINDRVSRINRGMALREELMAYQ